MCLECSLCCIVISIHALREEGDSSKSVSILATLYFYPRPPRGGRPTGCSKISAAGNFYPRPPRGGRLPTSTSTRNPSRFLSTPSARRATRPVTALCPNNKISIHALREEGDIAVDDVTAGMTEFLSTPSARRATVSASRKRSDFIFLSTPSARRATLGHAAAHIVGSISIHALREEGDVNCGVHVVLLFYFYPRPPRGGRQYQLPGCAERKSISIHALREEGDVQLCGQVIYLGLFLSTPSARRATQRPLAQRF